MISNHDFKSYDLILNSMIQNQDFKSCDLKSCPSLPTARRRISITLMMRFIFSSCYWVYVKQISFMQLTMFYDTF